MTTTPNNTPDNSDLLDTLKITQVAKRDAPGAWVTGIIGGHKFEALCFPEPASNPDYEIEGSNISKFWLADERGNQVASFDRGWDLKPATEIAQRITDLLAAGLAQSVYAGLEMEKTL